MVEHFTNSQRRGTILTGIALCVLAALPAFSDDKPPADAKPAAGNQAEKPATAGKKQDDPKAAKPQPPANPLSKLIRNIFGGKKPAPPAGKLMPADQPAGPDGKKKPAGNGDASARDHIDSRAPFDSRQASRLRRAQALMKNGQHEQAAEWLQRVLDTVDDKEDSITRLPDGRLESVSAQANRLLGGFPVEALESYRRQYRDLAGQQLLDARRQGDLGGIAEVADKYFHTPAGQEAANLLGTWHVDRGEFGPAARRYLSLLEADAHITRAPSWRLKAAAAFREAGFADALAKLQSQLSDSAAGPLKVGGRDVEPGAWLEGLPFIAAARPPQLDEWRMLYGGPQRRGTAVGGSPLLLERWSAPLTYNREIIRQVRILVEDLSDQDRTAVPAWHPLTVDNKIAFRTMRGVQVVDADTGALLWETDAGVSPEMLLTGQPAQPQYSQRMMVGGFAGPVPFNNRFFANYNGGSVDQHPLTGLLFRNGTFGLLSSHEEKLFVIEDHAILSQQQPGYRWGNRTNQNDPYRRDWSSNKLTAYGLADGRPLWEVGGSDTNESIRLPLAGTYFFGPPTPDGRELFVVGEKDNVVSLYSLDPQTGEPNWSQMLAVSESRIDEDFGRRWWPAQVSVSGGVIVCPTTLGWLVAVDRVSRSILWAYRYSPPQKIANNRFPRQVGVVPSSTFNQRWCPSAPIVDGNRVVYTPAEFTVPNSGQSAVVCLNLSTGERLWEKPKGNNNYLAGVFGGRAVVVGKNSVSALSLDGGATAWNRPIPPADGRPAGFGVAVANRYHLPLSSGQLWTLDLTDGSVAEKSWLDDRPERLGNLAMYGGTMVSLSPAGLTSFEQREAVLAEIDRRKQQNPRDPWALLREADMHVLNREYEAALAVLKNVPADKIDAGRQAHFREQTIACLTSIVRADFPNRSAELDQLAAFASRPEEQLHVRRLRAEQLESLEQHEAAFAVYRALADGSESSSIDRTDSRVTLPLAAWLSGRMRDLWAKMDDDARERIGSEIDAAAAGLGEDPAALDQFAGLYEFHPAARGVRQRLAAAWDRRSALVAAELQWLHIQNSNDAQVAAGALYRLARMMQERGLLADARYYYKLLAERYADVEVADGKTAGALYESLDADPLFQKAGRTEGADWGDFDLKLERTGATYSSQQQQPLDGSSFRLPYFRQFHFHINSQQKLAVVNVADGTLHWLAPLRGKQGSSQNYPVAQSAGHCLFVLYRDVLHCLSPLDRKVLWTRPLDTRGQSGSYYYHPNRQNVRPMQSGQSILSGQALVQQNSQTGMLAVANANYVCVYGRRKFTVLDAATGKVRWIRNRVPAHTRLVGNEDVLYMVPPNRDDAVALRVADGKPLDVPNVGALLAKAVHVSGRGVVAIESQSGSGILGLASKGATVVHQIDPLTKESHWRHSFPRGAYFTLLDGNRLAVLRKDRTFALLDLEDGRITECGALTAAEAKSKSQMYVVADRDNVYLLTNSSRRRGSYYSLGLPFVRVNGEVIAFDSQSGRRLWKQNAKVANQNLVLTDFEHSPVMTFAMRRYVRKGRISMNTLSIVAIDKATGRKLIESTAPYNSSFRSVDVNLADRYVELRSYNSRIRLVAVARHEPTEAPVPANAE